MSYQKRLGVFLKIPEQGKVKSRLVPPLSEAEACELYEAFLRDLFVRLAKVKKVSATVFHSGGNPDAIRDFVPKPFEFAPQEGKSLGNRLLAAFARLLGDEEGRALIIGSDSPDIPLGYLKRAFLKLKHKDVVIGPSFDGGYYLIGMKTPITSLFENIAWSGNTVLEETLDKIRSGGLSCSVLPPWYDVDDVRSLNLLKVMILARRVEHSDRLHHTERVLSKLGV
jgi:rSAM/selenodomain-associated transferase 1